MFFSIVLPCAGVSIWNHWGTVLVPGGPLYLVKLSAVDVISEVLVPYCPQGVVLL